MENKSMCRTKKYLVTAAVSVLLLLCAAISRAQITPLGDAYTNSADPTTKYGTATLLYVDGATETAYIQFNLASIPSGATVSQATLKLYVNAVTTAGNFNVNYVTSAWAESTLDYSNAPTQGSAIASDVAVTTADKNQYILINLTPAVEAWLSGSETNNGIALVANGTFNASFDSKENTGTSHPAELDIVFAPGSGGGTITGVTAGTGLTGGGTSGTVTLSNSGVLSVNAGSGISSSGGQSPTISNSGILSITAGTGITASSGQTPILGINTSVVPQLGAANTFTGNQTINGTVSATSFNIGSNAFAFGNYAESNAFLGFGGNSTMTGTGNTAAGLGALKANTTGGFNTAMGNTSLAGNTKGTYNTSLGYFSGQTLNSGTLGNNNTFIGAGAAGATVSGLTNATAIGSNAEVAESNALVLGAVTGTNGGTSVNVGIGTTTPAYTLDVHGSGNFSNGVNGSSSAAGTNAVYGSNTSTSGSSYGVYGVTASDFGAGVVGVDSAGSAGGYGVYGQLGTVSSTGSLGGAIAGLWGDGGTGSANLGVGIFATTDNGYAGIIENNSSSGYTTLVVGALNSKSFPFIAFNTPNKSSCNIDNNGNLNCTGSKNAVVPIDGGTHKVALSAIESPQNWFEDFGSARLSDGSAVVAIDPQFAQTVNTQTDYMVIPVPNGDCKGLYVTNKTPTSFEVRELGGGTSNIRFDYRIVVLRKDYENIRFADHTNDPDPSLMMLKRSQTGDSKAEPASGPTLPLPTELPHPAMPGSQPGRVTPVPPTARKPVKSPMLKVRAAAPPVAAQTK